MSEQKVPHIHVEVVYGTSQKQSLLALSVEQACTVEQVIKQSGIIDLHPEIDLSKNNVGIWNRLAKLTDQVNDGDRVEVYRPLIADPKEVRKRRAEKAKQEGRADIVTGGRVDPQRAKPSS